MRATRYAPIRGAVSCAVLAGALCALLASGTSAGAQASRDGPIPGCGPTQAMLAVLAEQYDEIPIQHGVADHGEGTVWVLASPGGATWTVLLEGRTGACIIASGTDWRGGPPAALFPQMDPLGTGKQGGGDAPDGGGPPADGGDGRGQNGGSGYPDGGRGEGVPRGGDGLQGPPSREGGGGTGQGIQPSVPSAPSRPGVPLAPQPERGPAPFGAVDI